MKTKLLSILVMLMLTICGIGSAFAQNPTVHVGNMSVCPGTTNVKVPITVHNLNSWVGSISLSLMFNNSVLTYTGFTSSATIVASGTSPLVNNPAATPNKIIFSWFSLSPIASFPDGDSIFIVKFTVNGSSNLNWDLSAASQGACEISDDNGYPYDVTWFNGGITAALPNADFTSTASVCSGTNSTVSVDFTAGTPPYTIVYNDGVNPNVTITTSNDPYTFTQNISSSTSWHLVSVSTATCTNNNVNKITTTTLSSGPLAYDVSGGGSICSGGAPLSIGLANSELGAAYQLHLEGNPIGTPIAGTGYALNFGNFSSPGIYTATGLNSCGNSNMTGNATILVSAGPTVTLSPFSNTCINAQAFGLTGGLPVDGTYSGAGITNGVFTPATAGPGSHVITYTYTENGCTNATTQNIVVESLPIISINAVPNLCASSEPVAFVVSPQGGVFTGTGVVGNTFDPALAGPGTWEVTYTYTEPTGAGCSNIISVLITVYQNTAITFNPLASVCRNAGPLALSATPSGGTFSGIGVENDQFLASVSGVGTFTVTYTYTNVNGCVASATQDITVNDMLDLVFNPIGPFCANAEPFILSDNGLGGTFSGTGVSLAIDGYRFNPAVAGPGVHTITYNLTDVNGCSQTVSSEATVLTLPIASFTASSSICPGSIADFTVVVSGGTAPYHLFMSTGGNSYDFITNDTLQLTDAPQITTEYSLAAVTDANSCTITPNIVLTVVVSPLPEITFEPVAPVCSNNSGFELIASPMGGTFSGLGVSGNQFVASSVGPGTYLVTYTYTNADNCTNEKSIEITVISIVYVIFDPSDATSSIGGNASFMATTANATSFQWQVSDNGGLSWADLMNDAHYSGVNSEQLNITNISATMSGNLYHLVASGQCEPAAVSAYATLNTISDIVTTAGSINTCANGDVLIPIEVGNFNDVAALSLTLDYSAGVTFAGFQDVNPLLDAAFLSVNANADHVKISYFNVSPINIGNGFLMNLKFTTSNVAATFSWDVLTPGNCEYQDLNFNTLPSQFTNGIVQIIPAPQISLTSVGPVCEHSAPLILSALPAGGTFSGDGVSDGWFYPEVVGAGTWNVTYSYNYGQTCTASASQNISVLALPVVGLTAIGPFCELDAPLALNGSPAGGVYSGAGVVNGMFSPAAAGQGVHMISYTYTTAEGCSASSATEVTVNELPQITFEPLGSVCSNSISIDLVAYPEGGTFSGPGITGNSFSPGTAGVGTFTLVYTYTNINGCTNSGSSTITVNDSPGIGFGPLADVCVNADAVTLWAIPAGGTFSGTGVIGGIFYPSIAGPGTFLIVYSYTSAENCSSLAVEPITVHALPQVTINAIAALCTTASPVQLSGSPVGGVFSGPGVAAGNFNPAVAGQGTHTITYTYTDLNGCSNSASTQVSVISLDNVSLNASSTDVCADAALVLLTGSPAGGTYSGTGVVGNHFNPQSGAGVYTVSYNYTNPSGCSGSASVAITVNALPIVFNVGGGGSFCSGGAGANVSLSGSQSGVVYTLYLNGTSTSTHLNGNGNALSFANITTVGSYSIHAASATCSAVMNGSASITINSGLSINAGNDVTINTGGNTSLTAATIGGTAPYTYLWTPGTGLNNASLPTVTASPLVSTLYAVMVMDALGCMGSDDVMVNVIVPQNNLSGTVTYPNLQASPLPNVKLTLHDVSGVNADLITYTDASGHYSFLDLAHANYVINASYSHVWGGGNAADGLMMLRHFTGLNTLTGLKLQAGDVTGNAKITANDALSVLRRFLGTLANFAPVGDWAFDQPAVTINGLGNQLVNFQGLCTGDVNADYNITGAKTAPSINVREEGLVTLSNGKVELPVIARENMSVGSFSMTMTLPSNLELNSVQVMGDNSNLAYHVNGNELKIGWFSLEPMNLTVGQSLLTLNLSVKPGFNGTSIQVDGNSVLTDEMATTISNASLMIPKISTTSTDLNFISYPNPVSNSATFSYTLAEAGKTQLKIFNSLGETISVITDEFQEAGFHSIVFDACRLAQGIYFSRITVNGITETKMITINR